MEWRAAKTIALDTAPVIYHLEAHSEFGPLVLPVFTEIESGQLQAVTATLTLLEILVQPYRLDDNARRTEMTALLTSFPNLSWVDLDLAIADRAASLRARYNLRTPDSIQIATAMEAGADVLLTNDRTLRRVQELPVLLVADLVAPNG